MKRVYVTTISIIGAGLIADAQRGNNADVCAPLMPRIFDAAKNDVTEHCDVRLLSTNVVIAQTTWTFIWTWECTQ